MAHLARRSSGLKGGEPMRRWNAEAKLVSLSSQALACHLRAAMLFLSFLFPYGVVEETVSARAIISTKMQHCWNAECLIKGLSRC